MCYNSSTFIKQLSGLSDRLIYLLRRARTHEYESCDSEIIDPTKVNYFRLSFFMYFSIIRITHLKKNVNSFFFSFKRFCTFTHLHFYTFVKNSLTTPNSMI